MDRDDLSHRSSRSGMEAHTDQHPPTARQHTLDNFGYRILVRRIANPPYGGKMDELKWDLLTEVQGRAEAEVFKTFLVANGIEDVEMFQESLGQHIYPTTLDILGNVQIYVPKTQIIEAQKLLKEYDNLPSAEDNEGEEANDV
jgi:hypothetical protein